MIVHPKDAFKLFGIFIIAFCAVFVCTLFLNFNIDIAKIKDQITDPQILIFYKLQVTSGNVTSAVSGGCLLLTSVVTLIFYIKRYIDSHKAELGILKALGYARLKIAQSFWVFGLSVFAGTAAGFCSSYLLMPTFYKVMNKDGILPNIVPHFNIVLALYLVILPTLLFSLLSVAYGLIKLKCPVLELIKESDTVSRKKRRFRKQHKEQDFLCELKQSTVKSRFSLVFFIAFAAFCYSAMTQMSLSMRTLSSEMFAIMVVGIGLVLAFTTLLLAITTIIKSNAKTIAILRAFGYSDRECGDAILNSYRPAAYIGFVIGTIYQYALLKIMVSLFYANSVVKVPEYNFDVKGLIASLVTFVLVYEFIIYVYSKQIKRISLKKIMIEE